ncbi:MAG TPA: OsmC-related (seleno)protein [Candidatus Methylomirabilis sp.]|jgi:organic hydroperoxide reductase OsmC/OhrA
MMTQIGRYGHMLKVQIDKVRMKVTVRYRVEGSVLANTVKGQCLGVEAELHLESQEDPARVARVVRNAENGCFVHQALTNPVPVQGSVVLNGAEMKVDQLFTP